MLCPGGQIIQEKNGQTGHKRPVRLGYNVSVQPADLVRPEKNRMKMMAQAAIR